MITGKIYKNKLSTFDDSSHFNHTTIDTKQIMRAKSQPGLNFSTTYLKPQNAQSIPIGTLKSQRQKMVHDYNQNSYMKSFTKQILQQHLPNIQIHTSACDQILEYQRKMKDHIQKVQARHQTKIAQLQLMVQAKNAIIQQLRSALKQKQKIIAKMQQQQTYTTPSISNTSRYR